MCQKAQLSLLQRATVYLTRLVMNRRRETRPRSQLRYQPVLGSDRSSPRQRGDPCDSCRFSGLRRCDRATSWEAPFSGAVAPASSMSYFRPA